MIPVHHKRLGGGDFYFTGLDGGGQSQVRVFGKLWHGEGFSRVG